MRRVVLVVIASLWFGCVTSSVVPCGDGTFCPPGTRCDRGRCLSPDEMDACDGKSEGDPCELDARAGACRAGACEPFFCGDGYLTGIERCDGDDLGPSDVSGMANCIDLGFYSPDGLACGPDCTYDLRGCEANGGGYCGDELVNGPELCDGAINRSCISFGFDAGSASCNTQCGFTIRDCARIGWNPESLEGLIGLALGGSGPADQWAVGVDGRVLRYDGDFWIAVPTPVSNPLIAVSALSRSDAWIVGLATSAPLRPSAILHWDGTSWTPNVSAPPAEYVDVWAAAANRVYVASNDRGIQRWNGSTWQELGMITGTPIAIRGTTSNGVDDIFVATNEGPLWRWRGNGWVLATPINAKLRFLDVNASDDVWGIGHDDVSPANGVIAHWDGAAWTTWRINGETYNNVASSGPEDTWVAVADDGMLHFDGTSWSRTLSIGVSTSGLAAISGLVSFGANEVVAVSTLGIAYRYRGMAFGRFPPMPTFDQNTAFWSSGPDNLYVVNVKGEIWQLDGRSWTSVFTIPELMPGTPAKATTVWGAGPDEIYVGTDDGRVFDWEGNRWDVTAGAGNPGVAIDVIWGSGPGDVWVFGPSGAFHREGSTWTRYMLSAERVLGVSGTGPSDIWAITNDSPAHKLWHWDGSLWTERTHGATTPINAVVAVATNAVFLAADDGRIARWDGTTWTEDRVPAVAPLRYMTATATDDVIAASERELFHFDGGAWTPMRTPVEFIPNTATFVPIRAIQSTPGRIDMLMDRLRVRTLIRTRPNACRVAEVNGCANGIDDDCDGKLDSVDDECP